LHRDSTVTDGRSSPSCSTTQRLMAAPKPPRSMRWRAGRRIARPSSGSLDGLESQPGAGKGSARALSPPEAARHPDGLGALYGLPTHHVALTLVSCRCQEQEHGGGVEQQRNHENKPSEHGLVASLSGERLARLACRCSPAAPGDRRRARGHSTKLNDDGAGAASKRCTSLGAPTVPRAPERPLL
jgi:hypothetical protein